MIALGNNNQESSFFSPGEFPGLQGPAGFSRRVSPDPEPAEIFILFVSEAARSERIIFNRNNGGAGQRLVEHFTIREHHLENPQILPVISARLGQLYSGGNCPITIPVHKPSLVEPVMLIVQSMQASPDTYRRIQLVIEDSLIDHPIVQDWLNQDLPARKAKITPLSYFKGR